MGSGLSREQHHAPHDGEHAAVQHAHGNSHSQPRDGGTTPRHESRHSASSRPGSATSSKIQTSIDSRIVATLRELNIARRQAPAKVKNINFERIVLRFGIARTAFDTIHEIYDEYAKENGLDYEGLKAVLNALGAEMNESDMREIFYEADMVRDNSLSQNEFVVCLAISYLLGLIKNFSQWTKTIVHTPEGVTLTPKDEMSARSSVNEATLEESASPELIAKALELMVTAYMLFDDDASGTIQTSEVRSIMQKHNETPKKKLTRKNSSMTTKAIRNERIKELDLDQDGTITFQEFVLTFQKWVGADDL